ncbi:MAG: hypothetical protein ACYTDV_16180 [Planctomycetota bacterium]|jgi:hypothetical protein
MNLTNRREVLGTLGTLPLVGMASSSAASGRSKQRADTVPTLATE